MIGLDHEYIPENAAQGDVPNDRPNVQQVYCEIMQMGACKLDSTGQERGVLNVTVQAHRIHTIPPWLSRMTGMTEAKRAAGIPFPEALKKLVDFVGNDDDVWIFSGDWWVLEGNAKAHGIELPFAKPFKPLKPLLSDLGVNLTQYKKVGFNEVCSGGLYQVLGITLPQIEGVGAHDAVHDARSMIHSIYHLRLT